MKRKLTSTLNQVNPNAAGIDIGAQSHWAAVPPDDQRQEQNVREFASFTEDLHRLADWLEEKGVQTVAMESTGVYWIPLFELLEARGFDVKLVDARQVKNVPGRKTDVLDCQWIQQLHSYGLLAPAFRPEDQVCVLRAYLRQKDMLIGHAAQHIQHAQKALTLMNLKLQHVVTDITGVTGMAIIRDILDGQHDPEQLAKHRDRRCKNDEKTIAKSLVGNYRHEHLFSLRQAIELFDLYQDKIQQCDHLIKDHLESFEDQTNGQTLSKRPKKRKRHRNEPIFDVRAQLHRMTGVDLTSIDGIDSVAALKVISEIGTDMSRWATAKHFASWLALCPGSKISGGKRISTRSRASANRAAATLRLCAYALSNSKSALGAFLRRLKSRLGPPKAITATAHKLARMVYAMLKNGTDYVDQGQDFYEKQYQKRVTKNLARRAKQLGYKLVPVPELQMNAAT